MRSLGLVVPLALLLSCGEREPAEPDDGIVLLSAREQLIRLSVDLRGVHPTEDELVAIEGNPDLYEQFVDRYLQDERFLDRIEEIYNQKLLTRTGELPDFDDATVPIPDGFDETDLADAIAEEPLKLIRWIVENDRPFNEVVTSDFTMADPLTAYLWNVEIPDPTSPEFQQGHYTDGRPHLGILTMTTVWTRYPSAGVNANRHRANNLSRILLCDDYLARPVSFSRTEIDSVVGGDPETIIRDTPTCQSCHSSLDPLAAHFFGFWWEVGGDMRDQTTYRPEDEELWVYYANKSPAFYGRPTHGLEEMAQELAEDPRLVDCAVETVFEGLTQRDVDQDDWTELHTHRDAFQESGLVMRDLVKSIVMDRAYRAGDAETDEMAEKLVTVKMVSPSQLAGIIGQETGYRWTFDGRDGLVKNDRGLAVLAGGIDSRYIVTPSHDPSVGVVFIQERLAQAAGYHVAVHDLDPDRTEAAILLEFVTADSRPETDRDAFAGQIRHLYREITGRPLEETEEDEAPEIQALIDVWKQLYSVEASPSKAWAGVISVVLRDPQVLFY
jgi:hypothetical protein